MIAAYKYIKEVNTREAEELFKLKDKVSIRANKYKFPMNKFKLEILSSFLNS